MKVNNSLFTQSVNRELPPMKAGAFFPFRNVSNLDFSWQRLSGSSLASSLPVYEFTILL